MTMSIDKKTGRVAGRILIILAAAWLLVSADTAKILASPSDDILVKNGTVMLPVVYGNEQAVTNLTPYLQQMPEFIGMSVSLAIHSAYAENNGQERVRQQPTASSAAAGQTNDNRPQKVRPPTLTLTL
jgi:hypothetical protein